jgi:hypothetical protein
MFSISLWFSKDESYAISGDIETAARENASIGKVAPTTSG